MKLLSSYQKEMKIAARGYYFYIEIFVAVILLAILLFAVKEESVSKAKEFIYYEMSEEAVDYLTQKDIDEGKLRLAEPTEFKLKAIAFDVTNDETGEVKSFDYDAATIVVPTYEGIDRKTGKLTKTVYQTETEEEMLRLAYQENEFGGTIIMDESGQFSFKYYNQGYETEKLIDLLYILHNKTPDEMDAALDAQVVRKLGNTELLNNRENLIPAMVVFMGSLMGLFIVMAYIFLDKSEGVIRAFAVTPSSVWKYLLSKTMVIITTMILSSSLITIPIMGLQPNYLLFYLMLIISSFAFSSLGLLISSFFDNVSQAVGTLYVFILALIVPAFSYYIPSFDPLWLRYFPTYPLLQSMREIIMVDTDVSYVLTYCAAFAVGGIILFLIANSRFKKTLTV